MDAQRLQRSVRTTLIGLFANALLAVIKMVAGWLGHSEALVADGVESMADVVSSVIVWRAVVVAAQPPDERHPYGHGKAEPVAALIVGLILMLAAGWIAVHAMAGAGSRDEAPKPFTLIILIAVIVIKEGLFRFVKSESVALESVAVNSDAWHHRSDAITSLAAGVGITVALVGGPDYRSADSIAAVFASGIVAWNGWKILVESFDELMDASARLETVEGIRSIASRVPGVEFVEKCIVRKTGGHYLVDMHVHVQGAMAVSEAHQIAHQVKDAVRDAWPQVLDVLVHLEPARDLKKDGSGKNSTA